jgi:alginate O-acetyltransferase complex protein AlgI
VVLVVALIMALGLHQTLWRRWGNALSAHWPPGPLRIAQALLLEVVLLLAILSMALGQYNPFIYFRF